MFQKLQNPVISVDKVKQVLNMYSHILKNSFYFFCVNFWCLVWDFNFSNPEKLKCFHFSIFFWLKNMYISPSIYAVSNLMYTWCDSYFHHAFKQIICAWILLFWSVCRFYLFIYFWELSIERELCQNGGRLIIS